MHPQKCFVSIVCPAFQEEEVLPLFHRELTAVLATLEQDYGFEIVYVDDGSKDGTLACLRRLAQADGRVRYLSLSRNFGHQAALTAGLEHARGDAVISMDCDLQQPPRIIPELLQRWQAGHDVVLTFRQEDPRLSLFKRLTARVFYQVMNLVSTTEVRLAAADFRLMSRQAVQAFLKMREQHRFVRGMVQWLGFSAAEVEYQSDPRAAGKTKYTVRKMLRLAGDGIFAFSNLPLRLPLYGGLAVWALGLFYLFVLLIALTVTQRMPNMVWHYLALLGHLVAGGVLCGMGVIGEYLGRVYDQVKQRPLYLLKESSLPDMVVRAEPAPLQRDAA